MTNMRAAVMGGLILAISGGLAASAQSPEMDFRVQARCLAVYEAAATAVEAAATAARAGVAAAAKER
jgi:hypothetical protein